MVVLPRGGTLLLPVANPETVDRLLDTGIDIARARSGRLIVFHVVQVPPQLPLSDGEVLVEEGGPEERMLAHADHLAGETRVRVDTRYRFARDVASGVVSAVADYEGDGLLIGWRGRPRRRDIILGSFVDRILGEAACNVFVERIRSPTPRVESVLVPVSGGPHGDLAVELGGLLAGERDARLHLVHVVSPDPPEEVLTEVAGLFDRCRGLLDDGLEVTTGVIEDVHVSGAITDETANHDLTVLGATEDPFLKRRLVGSVAEGVGRAAEGSVIMTRRAPGSVSESVDAPPT